MHLVAHGDFTIANCQIKIPAILRTIIRNVFFFVIFLTSYQSTISRRIPNDVPRTTDWKTLAYTEKIPHSYLPMTTPDVYTGQPFHSIVCLATGPYPLLNPVLHAVRSRASSFCFQYPLVPLRISNSCLPLLPRLPVTSSLYLSFSLPLLQQRVSKGNSYTRCDQSSFTPSLSLYVGYSAPP